MSEPAAIGTAFLLGLWTATTPCPLATNIAAVSYIAKRLGRSRTVILSGLLYTLGRAAAYTALGTAIVLGLFASYEVSQFLNRYLNRLLGPVLILMGMVLLELITLRSTSGAATEKIARRAENWGLAGALALGVLFALSFCPISAAIYFGSLLVLASKVQSPVLVPAAFGVATALPVAFFAFLLAWGTSWVGSVYNRLSAFERAVRATAGVLFIVVGIYLSLVYIWHVF